MQSDLHDFHAAILIQGEIPAPTNQNFSSKGKLFRLGRYRKDLPNAWVGLGNVWGSENYGLDLSFNKEGSCRIVLAIKDGFSRWLE